MPLKKRSSNAEIKVYLSKEGSELLMQARTKPENFVSKNNLTGLDRLIRIYCVLE